MVTDRFKPERSERRVNEAGIRFLCTKDIG